MFDKLGAVGAVLSAVAAPCCFPFFGVIGNALGLGSVPFLRGNAPILIQAMTALAFVGQMASYLQHRKRGPLFISMVSAGLVAPLNRLGRSVKAGLRSLVVDAELVCRIALVGKCVARVVQHNIEDNEQALLVGCIHEGAEFVVSGGRIVGEARLGADEVVDSVAVIRVWIEGEILQHRTEPDRSGSELLDVRKLLLHAGKFSALESEVGAEVRRKLIDKGHKIVWLVGEFGGYQAIMIDPETGVLMGGSDPRKDGCVVGW